MAATVSKAAAVPCLEARCRGGPAGGVRSGFAHLRRPGILSSLLLTARERAVERHLHVDSDVDVLPEEGTGRLRAVLEPDRTVRRIEVGLKRVVAPDLDRLGRRRQGAGRAVDAGHVD